MDSVFVFKKIVSAGLTPVALVIEMILAGLFLVGFSRRLRTETPSKRLLWLKGKSGDFGSFLIGFAALFLYLCSIEGIALPLSGLLERNYPSTTVDSISQPPEYIVVLPGGQRHWDQKPKSSRITQKTLVRLMEGVIYWRHYPDAQMIFSGLPTEVEPMSEMAIQLGVPENKIVKETKSRDTKDHAVYLKELLQSKPFLLVTSGNHMPRSMGLFEGQDLTPTPVPCDLHYSPVLPFDLSKLIPKTQHLQVTNDVFHEGLGIAWAKLRKQSAKN